jgi:hypothetical protein
MPILRTLWVAGTIASILTALHAGFIALARPESFLNAFSRDSLSWQRKVYVALEALGLFAFSYSGANALWIWIPASIGVPDDEGGSYSVRGIVAVILALTVTYALFRLIHEAPWFRVQGKIRDMEVEELQRIAVASAPRLVALKATYDEKRLERVGTETTTRTVVDGWYMQAYIGLILVVEQRQREKQG